MDGGWMTSGEISQGPALWRTTIRRGLRIRKGTNLSMAVPQVLLQIASPCRPLSTTCESHPSQTQNSRRQQDCSKNDRGWCHKATGGRLVGKRLNPPTRPRIRTGDEKSRPPPYCDLTHPDPEIKDPGFRPLKRGLDG